MAKKCYDLDKINAVPFMAGAKCDRRCPFFRQFRHFSWLGHCVRPVVVKMFKKMEPNTMLAGCCMKWAGESKSRFEKVILKFREKEAEQCQN